MNSFDGLEVFIESSFGTFLGINDLEACNGTVIITHNPRQADESKIKWRIIPANGGYHVCSAINAHLVLHQSGNEEDKSGSVILLEIKTNILQGKNVVNFEPDGKGWFRIIFKDSGNLLSARENTSASGSAPVQWDSLEEPTSQWRFIIVQFPAGSLQLEQINVAIPSEVFLSPQLVRQIASFSDIYSAERMRNVARTWRDTIPGSIVLSVRSWHERGKYADVDEPFFQNPSQEVSTGGNHLKAVHAKCCWKDQGWGNIKGKLFLSVIRGISNCCVFSQDLFGDAGHSWREENLYLTKTNFPMLFQVIQEGDRIQIWRHVGGGGGHELFVEQLFFLFGFY